MNPVPPALALAIATTATASSNPAMSGPSPALEAAPLPQATTTTMSFAEDLHRPTDLLLQGTHAIEGVDFAVPRGWDLVSDPVLHLDIEHSAQLDPDRSTLTVRIGDRPVASVRLSQDAAAGQRVDVPIRRDLLAEYNRLSLVVQQRTTSLCEDPHDPSLWARVGATSSLELTWRPARPELDLAQWPWPLFDPRGLGPLRIALADGTHFDTTTLQALADVGFALGRIAGYRHVEVHRSVPLEDQDEVVLLAIGTPETHPFVADVLRTTPHGADEGLVSWMPYGAHGGLALVVAGDDARTLRFATAAVASRDAARLGQGALARVGDIGPTAPPPSRQHPKPVPDAVDFTLADLGIASQTVRGLYAPPIVAPLKLTADSHPRVDARLTVRYAYAAQLDPKKSSIEVRFNGVAVRSARLDEPEGESDATLQVDIPEGTLVADGRLEVVFHLVPDVKATCEPPADDAAWATLHDTTTLHLPVDRVAELPDLSLLQNALWPYGTAVTGQGVDLVVDSDPDLDDAAAVLQFAAALGRVSTGDNVDLRAFPAAAETLERSRGREVVVLSGGDAHALWEPLASSGTITLLGNMARVGDAPRSGGQSMATFVEQILPAGDRSLLLLRAPTGRALLDLAARVGRAEEQFGLAGNAAVLNIDGKMRAMELVEPRQVGAWSWATRLRTALRAATPLTMLSLVGSGIIAASAFGAWVRRRGGHS